MSLKIVSSSDPIDVKQIVLCIYALPGIGKSTLANTADKPLVLDFDQGIYRSLGRRDSVIVTSWTEVGSMNAADLAAYNTIVVDTAGRCLDHLTGEIIRQNPKAARGSGALTLQGYGTLKTEFGAWLRTLKSYGKDVILLAHMDEQRDGDNVSERLDVQGGSKAEIYKSADAIAKLYIQNNVRLLDFSPREGSLGKNPAQFDLLTVPNVLASPNFLAETIAAIKNKLNAFGEKQVAVKKETENWKSIVEAAVSLQDVQALLLAAQGKSAVQKKMLMDRAIALGLEYDKTSKQFQVRVAA